LGGVIIAGGTVHYWQGMLSFVMFLFGVGIWMFARHAVPQATGQEIDNSKSANGQLSATATEPTKKPFVPYGRE
jgi:hypothetical protein